MAAASSSGTSGSPGFLRPALGGRVHLLPVVHDRLEMAPVARRALEELRPAGVAVELPTTLEAAVESALDRLPRISLLISEEDGEDALVWAVVPGDPLVEALRWAKERGLPRFYIDPDIRYTERHAEPYPDPYALWSLGPAAYLGSLTAAAGAPEPSELDRRREAGMAYHLRRALESLEESGEQEGTGSLLALLGAAHAGRVAELLEGPSAAPFARVRRSSVLVRHLAPRSLTALLPDPPLGHAAYELHRQARERGEELGPPPPMGAALRRSFSLVRDGLKLLEGGRGKEPWDADRRRRLAAYAAHHGSRPGIAGDEAPAPDRWLLASVVWAVAVRSWKEQQKGAAGPASPASGAGGAVRRLRRVYLDFAHRMARVAGRLAPGLYEWVVAARGVADDNLAWEVFQAARTYPWQEESAEIPSVEIDGDELDLGTRKIRFRRRFFRVKQRPVRVPVRERPALKDPAEWLAGFDGELCSYPPEDVVIEDYGRFLQARAVGILRAEREKSERFSGSLLDGIDLRETLRRSVGGSSPEIWVRELGQAPGRADSVVVIFDTDDGPGERYPYLMTWLGEHEDESDMAFYATDPAEQIVGPGITRAVYGGFTMTYPPGRMEEVWLDPDYAVAHSKAEVLARVAVDYSLQPLVAHVAKLPPSEALRRYAALRGKRLVHIPLGSLSPPALQRLRTVHLLSGKDKRAIARDYV